MSNRSSAGPSADPPESRVIKIWQERLRFSRTVLDSRGIPHEIIYPGRPNDGPGGDFRDALVSSGRDRRQGNIEIHTRADSWQAHGHHRDPAYNRVILHVAFHPGCREETLLENGEPVPTVILDEAVPSRGKTRGLLPCEKRFRKGRRAYLLGCLQSAGIRRLEIHSERYSSVSSPGAVEQALYEGILEALGYTQNRAAFLKLAALLPLPVLEAVASRTGDPEESLLSLQAFLLGTSGLISLPALSAFLPEQRIQRLAGIWESFLPSRSLSCRDWALYRVRPGNHPVVRLLALGHLLLRFREKGLLNSLLELFRQAPLERCRPVLESHLRVESHSGENCQTAPETHTAVLLGRPRAAEIVINVLLPFFLAWSRVKNEPELGQKALELFCRYPRLETNSIERHMLRQLSLPPEAAGSACLQQGLLQIYKSFCIRGRCPECGLSGLLF